MFRKQKGKCLLFLYILTLKLTILRPCLGSAGIKTFATAGDFNKKSQTSGHFDEVDRVYSKMDGKWGRFGRLIFGRAAQNVKVAVSVDTARKDGLLKNQLGSYAEYGDVPLLFSARSSSDTANSARQSYQQLSTSLNLSRSLDAEPKTESFSTVIPGGTREQNENVTMKDWSSQSDGDNVGCTLGEIDWKPLADKEDTTRTGSKKYQDGYQSDSAPRGVEESRVAQGEVTALYPSSGSPVPLVQCGSNNMSLTVRRSEAAHLLVDQGKPPPLPLSQLPPHCGYSVKTTQRDLVFMALYDGCHVRQQDGSYILQLLWWGTRVKMSCLVSPPPLSLCCNPFGMTITIGGSGSADEIGVEMDREWRPLTSVALQCGYIMETHPGKVVVSVPFTGCGVTIKDGKHTLSIRSREKESTLSCPFLPSAPSPSPALRPTPLPAIPEQYPKFPMFYWLQPHYPVATPPAEITHAYHPPSFPHFYHKPPLKSKIKVTCGFPLAVLIQLVPTGCTLGSWECCLSPCPFLPVTVTPWFWDMALGELLVLDLKCPYSPGSSTQSLPTERPTAHKPQGYCMADHMSVGLPPGVRDVIVQDIKGNKIRLQEAPEDCGYTVRKDNSGDIMLNLPFTSCLMTIQGQDHVIGIKVLSEHGLGAEWLSCPVAQPNTKQGHMADDGGVSQPEESPSYQPKGEFGVQLRISTDQNYTSYYPQNRRRFQLLLGRPLFLEVRLLNAPYPTLALLVHYCLAYSSSTKAPWLLIYDSCPGRPDRQSPPPPVPPSPVRRFTITTFQRLPSGYFSPNEEINFMCSTAVCSESERPCVEGCFTRLVGQSIQDKNMRDPTYTMWEGCEDNVFLLEQKSQFTLHDATPRVTCTSRYMRAVFGPGVQNSLQIKDRSGVSLAVSKAMGKCGVKAVQGKDGLLSFYSLYDSSCTHIEGDFVVVVLRIQLDTEGPWYRVNISCPLKDIPKPTVVLGTCRIQKSLRVACGPQGISRDACLKLGCCYCRYNLACYYRIDTCSLDGNFVFSVKASQFQPPISLSSLRVKGQPQCIPVAATTDTAVFKFGVTECGTKRVVLGKVVSYEVEVEELSPTPTVARESPFSLQVQCQYAGSVKLQMSLLSKDPTKPPLVSAAGNLKVQMRIATDDSFSSFIPKDQLPLVLSLRTPVHVEVSFAGHFPDPSLSLRLRDCFAFPASRHSLWMLLHDGCPNPLDSERSSVMVGNWGQSMPRVQVRRFDVKTFAFIDPKSGAPSMEELYFYCWVEICAEEDDCQQQCPSLSYDGGRLRRESRSDRASQLVSFGPVLLGRNSRWEESHGDRTTLITATVYQKLSVFSYSIICISMLFFLLFSAWSWVRKSCQSGRSNQEPDISTEMEPAYSVDG
ncbi:hypothetical protein AAFF_G00152340 [Aldrovandia affinis]|uniref:ZP domain-containing protein n=1 Tax=Aldrovandia affinis TaxID=143900 RepID=A0AAD7W8N7_9TELE|nr:hypothetical protein AAFF_G00152340 [Aldrovandia affinis]